MASTRARALQLGNTLGTEPFLVHGISAENPVNQKLTEMHMAGHRVRLDSNLLRVRLHMSSVHGIYQRDPRELDNADMQATRLNKPILHTDDVRFCLLWGAEKG